VRLTPPTGKSASHESVDLNSQGFSLHKRLLSFRYAGNGLRLLARHEHNAWIHLTASLLVAGAGFALHVRPSDWRWLVAAMALVWMAEAFNTAIEALCDRICIERDVAIGRIKDLAAGAVLIAAITAATIGLLTFLPYLKVARP
jgi:diacylglycerol kinase (ATP)